MNELFTLPGKVSPRVSIAFYLGLHALRRNILHTCLAVLLDAPCIHHSCCVSDCGVHTYVFMYLCILWHTCAAVSKRDLKFFWMGERTVISLQGTGWGFLRGSMSFRKHAFQPTPKVQHW